MRTAIIVAAMWISISINPGVLEMHLPISVVVVLSMGTVLAVMMDIREILTPLITNKGEGKNQ